MLRTPAVTLCVYVNHRVPHQLAEKGAQTKQEERESEMELRGSRTHCHPAASILERDSVNTTLGAPTILAEEVTNGFGPLQTLLENLSAAGLNREVCLPCPALTPCFFVDPSAGIRRSQNKSRSAPPTYRLAQRSIRDTSERSGRTEA